MHLYIDPRSSASLRVSCLLAHKGVSIVTTELRLMAGEHEADDYAAINPGRTVPALVLDDGRCLNQSLAIMEFLEDTFREHPILPPRAADRASVRALCGMIASDIHPLTNMKVRNEIGHMLAHDEDAAARWCRRWTEQGLVAFEQAVQRTSGRYCFGDAITMADFCLAPQVLSAKRFGCDLALFATTTGIYERCCELPAFLTVRKLG